MFFVQNCHFSYLIYLIYIICAHSSTGKPQISKFFARGAMRSFDKRTKSRLTVTGENDIVISEEDHIAAPRHSRGIRRVWFYFKKIIHTSVSTAESRGCGGGSGGAAPPENGT